LKKSIYILNNANHGQLRGRSQISSRFKKGGGWRAVGEFMTVQTQIFSFFGKFVTWGGEEEGVEKVIFFA